MKNFNKALSYSFLLLKYRARSRDEIVTRLKNKGYTSAVREKVVSYLKENNYINDKEFAHLFVSYSLEKGWGPVRIDFNLKRLGISPQLRKQALAGDFAYSDRVREIITKKIEDYKKKRPSLSRLKIWQKITMYLARKGFDYKVINQGMDNLGEKRFEDE